MAIRINQTEYRDKVLACWMGKNIGGTLGAPFEWKRQVNHVEFYAQDLHGENLPNDDLDLQLLWLIALEERGVDLDAHTLADYWSLFIPPHWGEYGTGKANMRLGLPPPLSGNYGNIYKDSCGAFIRSEIWACITPGLPQLAARYAYEDAIVDHGNGEGTYAAVFCAAMESAAFVESDIDRLIAIGLSYIPEECGVARATRQAIASYREGITWREARDRMLTDFRGGACPSPDLLSPEDRAKEFHIGPLGWDVPSNIGMLIIGLLYGEGDFGKSICTAVNCGEDTDCTGATVGALFGIIHGTACIPEHWIAPIGRGIKTGSLNLGDLGYYGDQLPATIDALTDRTIAITRQVLMRHDQPVCLTDDATDLSALTPEQLNAGNLRATLFQNMNATVHRFDRFIVSVDYGAEGPLLRNGAPKTLVLRVESTYRTQTSLNVHWYAPENWHIAPTPSGTMPSFPPWFCGPREMTFTVETEAVQGPLQRAAIEITLPGYAAVMLVPVTLVNANLLP